MKRPDRCETCRYFEDKSNNVVMYDGECRRLPPHVLSPNQQWARVTKTDWCGEWRVKADAEA